MDMKYEDKDSIFFHISLGIAIDKVEDKKKDSAKEKMHHTNKVVDKTSESKQEKKQGIKSPNHSFSDKNKQNSSSSQKSHE